MINTSSIVTIVFVFLCSVYSQNYISADPSNILLSEYSYLSENDSLINHELRPIIHNANQKWYAKFRSENYYSSTYPNWENNSNIWVGRGITLFNSLNLSYNTKYLFVQIEPFIYYSQNFSYREPERAPKFNVLNDNRIYSNKNFYRFGLRETQIYLKYNDFGIGFSNANNWWGNGIHNSLMLSNNTTGFVHLSVGTLQEKRIRNFGINFRYLFSKLEKYSIHNPYYNSFALFLSHYSKNILSIGLSKAVILGGDHSSAEDVGFGEALFSVFSDFGVRIGENRDKVVNRWTNDDNLMVGYISYFLKKEKIKFYLEFGKNDWIWDFRQFFVFPENSIAYIVGMRIHDLFNKNISFSIEYANTKFNKQVHINEVGDWYDKEATDFFSYDGRRFAAHCGSDADDLLITVGWHKDNFSIVPSFNYERHGLTYGTQIGNQRGPLAESINRSENDILLPEAKYEFRLYGKYKYKNNIFKLNLELEKIFNRESIGSDLFNFIINIGFEKELQFKLF